MIELSSYTKEEKPILQYLVELMRVTNLPIKHIHVLNELLRCAIVDYSELETGRVLILTRENKLLVERWLNDSTPTPIHAAMRDFQRAGILQIWSNGSYRFNPDIFGKRAWYVNGKPNIKAVKLRIKQGRKEKKVQTIRVYCDRTFWNKGKSTYKMAY